MKILEDKSSAYSKEKIIAIAVALLITAVSVLGFANFVYSKLLKQ
jgi:hypothetical protein